jgi:hypothetical protein
MLAFIKQAELLLMIIKKIKIKILVRSIETNNEYNIFQQWTVE